MRKKMLAALAVGTAVVMTAGCGGGSADDQASAGLDTVNYAIQQDPGVLNPLTNPTSDGVQLANFAYESLLSMPAGQEPTGLIAKEWKSTTKEATFTLKDNVACADGTALKASDVKATFEYVINNAPDSQYIGVYIPQGVTIDADDAAKTVTFKVSDPQSFLAEAVGQLPIVCPSGLKDPKALDTKTFGTGPYQLDSMTAGQTYAYTRVSGYASGLPEGTTLDKLPQKINVSVVTDQSTQTNMLTSGDLNIAKIQGSNQDRIDGSSFTSTKVGASPLSAFFNQNSERPTGSLEVRQAIAQALDRQKVGTAATAGKGELMKTLQPYGSSICPDIDSSSAIADYDLSKAKSALDSAGWAEGGDGVRTKDGKKLTIKILYNSNAGSSVAAGVELMQKELSELGVDAQLTPSDSYTDVIFSGGDWDICVSGISASTPAEWYGIFSGDLVPNGGNWTYNQDDTYFSLASDASNEAGEASCPAWQKAEEQLFKNVTVLPIAQSVDMYYAKGFSVQADQTGNIIPTSFKVA